MTREELGLRVLDALDGPRAKRALGALVASWKAPHATMKDPAYSEEHAWVANAVLDATRTRTVEDALAWGGPE